MKLKTSDSMGFNSQIKTFVELLCTNQWTNHGHFCALKAFYPSSRHQINQVLKKQYFGHDMPVCVYVPTVH